MKLVIPGTLPGLNQYIEALDKSHYTGAYVDMDIFDMDLLNQLADSGAWVDFTQGLDCRLLTAENIGAIGAVKLKEIHFAWDYMAESDAVLRGLRRYVEHGN